MLSLSWDEKINDIIIREILNIQEYITISKNKFINNNSYKNVSYFYINSNTICIGFLIKTNYKDITIPIITMKDIRIKINLKLDLLKYINFYKKKKKINNYLILIYYTTLPIEMINKIMSFY
jgi:hypothetical protein